MAKPKKIKDAVRHFVVLSKGQVEQVQHMAIQTSMQEDRQITVSEAK